MNEEIIQKQETETILAVLRGQKGWTEMGGPGSGHHRHKGRKGKRGGSIKSGRKTLAQGRLPHRPPSRPGRRGGSIPRVAPEKDIISGDYMAANFAGKDFSNKKIKDSDFRAADLSSADFTNAVFENTKVANAVFNGAQLQGADMRGTIGLAKAQMAHAVYNDQTQFPKGFDPENIPRGWMYKE